jgi:RNA polymerase sigma-70 factor, ECF subfamily
VEGVGPPIYVQGEWLRTTTHRPIVTEPFDNGRGSIGSTSSSFLDRVKARDYEAWRRLASVYVSLVLWRCQCKGVEREEDRADVCQDVFCAVAANIDSFERDQTRGTFRGWLRTIADNKINDFFRRTKRQPPAEGGTDAHERFLAIPDGDGSRVSEASDEEDAIIVQKIRDLIRPEFEDRTWQAFWRTVVDGDQSGVVADALGMKPGAVRQAKSRVLRRLRKELDLFRGLEGYDFLGGCSS